MNCVKGELAMTCRAPMDNDLLVVVLEKRGMHAVYGPLWLVESLGSPFHIDIAPLVLSRRAVWPDCMLRPIRDPGPDAVDETLMDNPAPVLEEVAS